MRLVSTTVPGLLLDDGVSGRAAERLWQTSALRELREEELSEPETPLHRLEMGRNDGIDSTFEAPEITPTFSNGSESPAIPDESQLALVNFQPRILVA